MPSVLLGAVLGGVVGAALTALALRRRAPPAAPLKPAPAPAPALPRSKRASVEAMLERGSCYLHLDPRREGVVVPPWLAKKSQLVLQIGRDLPRAIPDLAVDDDGVRCTLSFDGAPYACAVPYSALYALVADDGENAVWTVDLPADFTPDP